MNAISKISSSERYARCVETSKRVRWDIEDDNVPVPGGEMTGYLRIQPHPQGAYVEVHQIVDTPAQAEFMERAWAMVLGRLQAGVVRASDPDAPMPLRPARPKRRD